MSGDGRSDQPQHVLQHPREGLLVQGSMETCGAICLRVEGTNCPCFAVWGQDGQSHGLSPDAPEFSQAEAGSLATAGAIEVGWILRA